MYKTRLFPKTDHHLTPSSKWKFFGLYRTFDFGDRLWDDIGYIADSGERIYIKLDTSRII